ncbi:MAG TPA: ATP-dependent DNA helicase [Candidatus Paceibacterota bacterium]|jgi:DNA helicase-2/ATP-dependent DNA helicase PcrA|nr:ATP-dependent DNA helicase [Candidatus Paceibacterota bacterium]
MTDDTFKKDYKELNPAQKEAVDATEGPVMVVAGPGTGKTQILALRIAKILKGESQTDPDSILALTYTNAGVISMRKRLIKIIGERAYKVNIFTFHGFCEHVIKEFSFYFEELEGARVIGDLERVEIIESIIKENKFKDLISFHDEFSFLSSISGAILAIKKEGLSPEEFLKKLPVWEKELMGNDSLYYKKDYGTFKKGDIKPAELEKINKKISKSKELARIFSLYQENLKKLGLYDFSDMILYVLEELVKNKDLKADVQEKYQYILVDEHQDTNQGQNTIIELLTDAKHLEGKPNIFTVGDEKQSIYRFQGASAETFSRFQNLYKDIHSITLSKNYRSTQDILDGAHSLIVKSKDLEGSAHLQADSKENEKINVREFSNYKFELLYIAEDIQEKIKNGVLPGEIAVLYRANKNVSDVKTIFDFYRIPYSIFSKDKILDDPNIINLIHILKVIFNPNDDHNLGKALFAKFLYFDAYDIVKIHDKYRSLRKEERKHIFSIIEDSKTLKEIEVKNLQDFSNFSKLIKDLKTESSNQTFPDFFKIFLNKIGYIKYMLSSADSRLQLVKLDKLMDEIKRQVQSKKEYNLADFIFFVDSFAKYNLDIKSTDPEIIEGVSLMTAHGSKGREFEHVYIINSTRKSWEKRRGKGNHITLPIYQHDGDLEDERRLFYVAMTRAKKTLSISFSRTDNDGREHEESQFVKEIDTEFKDEQNMKEFEEKNVDKLSSFMNSEKKSASVFEPEYLRQLFWKRGLNVSALKNYLNCPKEYLYKNLIQIPDTYSLSQKFGNIVDFALNNFFEKSKKGSKILSQELLLEEFEKGLRKFNLPDKEEEKFRERGEKAFRDYYNEYSGIWTAKVSTQFHIEREFELDTKKLLKISGTLDKIEYIEDLFSPNINVVDHKTGKPFSEKTKDQKADYERQLIFYNLLLMNYPKKDFKIHKSILDFVEKNKKGEFEQYSLDVTKEHLDKLRQEINTCAEEVLSMEFLEKGCGKKTCEWCQLEKLL